MGINQKLHDEFMQVLGGNTDVANQVKITSKGVKTNFYTSSGVDIEAGDGFSAAAGKVCKGSINNSPFVKVKDFSGGNFRGPKGIQYVNLLEGTFDTLAPDGVGTKPIIIDAFGSLAGAAHDVVSMTGDDIARYGGVPLVFTSVLDVAGITDKSEPQYIEMMKSLGELAHNSKFVILNGETAELPDCVTSSNPVAVNKFNWAGVMAGKYHPDKMITGEAVQPGDRLIALKQEGFRSNGISAVRKAFQLEYGNNYYTDAPHEEIAQASAPSTSYAYAIAQANGWYSPGFKAPVNMTGIAHLSGGSFKGKLLEDMLGVNGYSAEFDNLFPIPEIAKKVAIWSQKGEKPIQNLEELYSTFCSGQGMVVAVKPDTENIEAFINLMADNGIDAQDAGVVTETPSGEEPSIMMKNIR